MRGVGAALAGGSVAAAPLSCAATHQLAATRERRSAASCLRLRRCSGHRQSCRSTPPPLRAPAAGRAPTVQLELPMGAAAWHGRAKDDFLHMESCFLGRLLNNTRRCSVSTDLGVLVCGELRLKRKIEESANPVAGNVWQLFVRALVWGSAVNSSAVVSTRAARAQPVVVGYMCQCSVRASVHMGVSSMTRISARSLWQQWRGPPVTQPDRAECAACHKNMSGPPAGRCYLVIRSFSAHTGRRLVCAHSATASVCGVTQRAATSAHHSGSNASCNAAGCIH